MIAFMEITSRTLLDEHLPDTHSSVGALVNVRHLAPSPLGSTIHTKVIIEKVDGNKITLSVSALEGEAEVGKGTHERYVIEVDRFLKRIEGTD
jgi:predicted thioesterase